MDMSDAAAKLDRADMFDRIVKLLRRHVVEKEKPTRWRIESTHGGEGLVVLAIIEPVPTQAENPPDSSPGGADGPNGGPGA